MHDAVVEINKTQCPGHGQDARQRGDG
jgi:hypothetical protein